MAETQTSAMPKERGNALEVFRVFLLLGLTSFGGPVAHLGYFREAIVRRRGWLSEAAYADLVALCQFLPGPASSQVGMAIGMRRAGLLGLLAAFIGFTLPSALLMGAFAAGITRFAGLAQSGAIDGMKAAAVAVVAHALIGMAGTLATGPVRAGLALLGMLAALVLPGVPGQLLGIGAAGVLGLVLLRDTGPAGEATRPMTARGHGLALAALAGFAMLLIGLPILAAPGTWLGFVDSFYRAGALVFGGGHVVLPLLQAELVAPGVVERDLFIAGYGAAQAVPGPLFSFASYLGFVAQGEASGVAGALIATLAIFLPSALLVIGVLPYWNGLRANPLARRALGGVNAGVVGLLGAALYDPVFTGGVQSPLAMAVAATAFVALAVWRLPAWAVVIGAGLVGVALL